MSLEATDAEIGRAWSDIYTPNEAMARTLQVLKARGLRLVLASNTNELHHDWFDRVFAETLSVFDAHVLSYQVGSRKPDRQFFDGVPDRCGVPGLGVPLRGRSRRLRGRRATCWA